MKKQLTFEQALTYCLDELARTGNLEASLRPYPHWAEQLRPLLEMAQATRQVYRAVPEPPHGLADGRRRMLAAAAGQRTLYGAAPTGARSAPRRRFMPRWVAVTWLIVLSVIVLGGGVVRAAANSLPGDWLYPVKWTVEDTRMALAADATARTYLALEFVAERVGEMQTLAATGRSVPDGVVARMGSNVEQALVQAAWAPDADLVDLLTQMDENSRAQVAVLEQARQGAAPEAAASISRAIALCRQGGAAATDGLRDPQMFRQRYRHPSGMPAPSVTPTASPTGHPPLTPTLQLTASPTPPRNPGMRGERTPPVPAPTITPPGTPPAAPPTVTPQRTPPTPRPTTTPIATAPGPQATPAAQHPPVTPKSPGESPTPQGQSETGGGTQAPQGPAATNAPTAPPQGPPADAGDKKQN